ncbi:hypothetical protein LTR84_001860 [Exophiala bonariae]|uniref:Uncharacterized protein n=1 Tax=Exophiala bonariae TaxID=1690606 RepID=A0AAV9NBP5_9EURO|nr:hypothetical protein LTR84_001860 [Exophiala bonariae]
MQLEPSSGPAGLPNSSQWNIKNPKGEIYHIQAAWPLAWDSSSKKGQEVPVFYVLDANAYFFGTVEAVRRNGVLPGGKDGIVIGIGYPPSRFPFDGRRNYDLTPPSPHYAPPLDADGKAFAGLHGGATEFLEFVVKTVRELLFTDEGPFSKDNVSMEVLVGHSYGGLCTLHALFTRATPFQAFVAISPSIWWNDKFLLSEQDAFLERGVEKGVGLGQPQSKPLLFLAYGSLEQDPIRAPTWTDEQYAKQVAWYHSMSLGKHTEAMYGKLKDSESFDTLRFRVYEGEDHLSVAMNGISWAISSIVDLARFG